MTPKKSDPAGLVCEVLLPLGFAVGIFVGFFLFFVLDNFLDLLWWDVLSVLPDEVWWWLWSL
jgi:hypothetical protein